MSDLSEIGEVRRLSLKPGDVLVVHCKRMLKQEQHAIIRETIETRFPGHKCLVMCDGLELSVVEPDA